jgi:hypothetical protein
MGAQVWSVNKRPGRLNGWAPSSEYSLRAQLNEWHRRPGLIIIVKKKRGIRVKYGILYLRKVRIPCLKHGILDFRKVRIPCMKHGDAKMGNWIFAKKLFILTENERRLLPVGWAARWNKFRCKNISVARNELRPTRFLPYVGRSGPDAWGGARIQVISKLWSTYEMKNTSAVGRTKILNWSLGEREFRSLVSNGPHMKWKIPQL